MSDDHRRDQRRAIFKGAKIVFHGGYSTAECIVKNISTGGARLKFGDITGIPSRFTLKFDDGSLPARECIVRWRANGFLGVQFVDGAESDAT
jgi:hypothetical protein